MTNPQELVLYYDPLPLVDIRGLSNFFAAQGVQLKPVAAGALRETVGHLAGLQGFPAQAGGGSVPRLTEPVMVFCGLTRERLDGVLDALRREGLAPKALKAVLTGTNCTWSFARLAGELQSERAAIARSHGSDPAGT